MRPCPKKKKKKSKNLFARMWRKIGSFRHCCLRGGAESCGNMAQSCNASTERQRVASFSLSCNPAHTQGYDMLSGDES